MTDPIHIGLIGATGRMGMAIREVIDEFDDLEIEIGIAAETTDVEFKISTHVEALRDADVAIDFSTPQVCVEAAEVCAHRGIPLITGTTGLDEEQTAAIVKASERTAIVSAANFSVGVNILHHLVGLAAQAADDWDIEVLESHHRHKVDAPSGTALFLGEAAADAQDRGELSERMVGAREGQVGARTDDEIGFQVIRGGSIVGEHTVFFIGNGERIELTHRALDRRIFARGALRAARWVIEKAPGLYGMRDVLFD